MDCWSPAESASFRPRAQALLAQKGNRNMTTPPPVLDPSFSPSSGALAALRSDLSAHASRAEEASRCVADQDHANETEDRAQDLAIAENGPDFVESTWSQLMRIDRALPSSTKVLTDLPMSADCDTIARAAGISVVQRQPLEDDPYPGRCRGLPRAPRRRAAASARGVVRVIEPGTERALEAMSPPTARWCTTA